MRNLTDEARGWVEKWEAGMEVGPDFRWPDGLVPFQLGDHTAILQFENDEVVGCIIAGDRLATAEWLANTEPVVTRKVEGND